MKHHTNSQTILRWLRENEIPLGALTSHDTAALYAAVQIANLWVRGDTTHREMSEVAFENVVLQMQETTRFLAFQAIAHAGDWNHRQELWIAAGLPDDDLIGKPDCRFAPGGRHGRQGQAKPTLKVEGLT